MKDDKTAQQKISLVVDTAYVDGEAGGANSAYLGDAPADVSGNRPSRRFNAECWTQRAWRCLLTGRR